MRVHNMRMAATQNDMIAIINKCQKINNCTITDLNDIDRQNKGPGDLFCKIHTFLHDQIDFGVSV